MKYDFDSYLLYERNRSVGFTVRIRVVMKEEVRPEILGPAAVKAFKRYPYYSQTVSVDDSGAYILHPCDAPIAVMPDELPVKLGGEETNGLLFAITYRNRDIYFNFSHNFCGGCGAMFWIKTTLWQYLTDMGFEIPEEDIKLPGTPVTPGEVAVPDPSTLPGDEPLATSGAGDSFVPLTDYMEVMKDPQYAGPYYYPISIRKTELLKYARENDGSPNSILSAVLYKMSTRSFADAEQLSGKVICNYRGDVGCPETHCDLVRFIRTVYKPVMKDWPVDKISTATRGSMYLQMEPEYSWRECRELYEMRQGIDEQPDLEAKKKYAVEHSLIQRRARDTFAVSYVGNAGWGALGDYIEGVYSITDGHLMLEVNATEEGFCISFQTLWKDGKYLKGFLKVLDEEGIHYQAGELERKNLPVMAIM
ncbi:MAG: hypothetical protein J5966_07050 [Lachnospiraceae bacterium]|nr:hypothetical protein [Lachnospiraceae bacterium]